MLLSGDGHYVVCSMYYCLSSGWILSFFFAMQHNILLSNTFKDTFSSLTCTMQCCIRVHVSGYYINSWISSRYTYRELYLIGSVQNRKKLFWNFRLSANWTRDMKKGKIYINVTISSVCLCFHLNFLLLKSLVQYLKRGQFQIIFSIHYRPHHAYLILL